MRKFLSFLLLCLALPVMAAGEPQTQAPDAQTPAPNPAATVAALKAFKAPMQEIVREAAKGQKADLAVLGKSIATAKETWFKVTAQAIDLNQHGIPADDQDEVWRELRKVGLLVEYLDQGATRSDRALILRSAGMLKPAYDKVAAAFKIN